MADTKFMNFAEATAVATDSVLIGNTANGVRRAQLSNLREAIGATALNCGGIVDGYVDPAVAAGYVKFANNLIVQWGEWECAGNIDSVNVTFPIPFTGNYAPFVCVENAAEVMIGAGKTSSSAMSINKPSALDSATRRGFWFAVGA